MRKFLAPMLLGLGAFLIAAAVLATTWVPGVVKKTPLDVDNTTRLAGEAQRLDGDELGPPVPIKVTSITQSDAKASDDDVVVFINGSCVVENADGNAPDCVAGDDARLVTATEDTFATDRVSALSVPNGDYLPVGTVQHDGLMNKWPFDAEKKTYPLWDGTTGRAVDAVYVGTEEIEGVETYHYRANIDQEPIEILDGANGTYTNEINIYVEPRTGDIMNQSQDQQRYLDDGTQVLNLQAQFTDEQIQKSTDSAKSNVRRLDLMLVWVPVAGFVVGGFVLLAGVLLLVAGRRRPQRESTDRRREHAAV